MPVKINGSGYIGTANNIYTDGSGRVGIGTPAPGHKLHVAGTYANGPSMDPGLGIENTAASRVFKIRVGDGGLFAINDTTAGADRVIVDTSGRITLPYQPAFRAYLTASQTYSSAGTVIFNSAPVNRGSIYNTSNGRFTAPVSGVYYISHFITFQLNSAANQRGCDSMLYLNGSMLDGAMGRNGAYAFTSGYYAGTGNSVVVSLSAGDYLEVRGSVFDNSANYFFSDESTFSGFLIG